MKEASRIVVFGSANIDLVARVPRLPAAGETVLGSSFAMLPGGKGANQAVAAARLGGQVQMVGRVGSDPFGDKLIGSMQEAGVETSHVVRDSISPTGVALIGVAETGGENNIIVAPGANINLSAGDIAAAEKAIAMASVVVCSLEVPIEAVGAAVELAAAYGVQTILNPAPAQLLPELLLSLVSVLTPNEHEAAILAGDQSLSPIAAAKVLVGRGCRTVIVTLGSAGAAIVTGRGEAKATVVAPPKIGSVVDTTAAGDCFTGALAVAMAEGRSLEDAVRFANCAAALSVTKPGAQDSMPTRQEVEVIMSKEAAL